MRTFPAMEQWDTDEGIHQLGEIGAFQVMLRRNEEMVQRWEAEERGRTGSVSDVDRVQGVQRVQLYRRFNKVHPADRHELRRRLAEMVRMRHGSLAEVIEEVNRQSPRNGDGPWSWSVLEGGEGEGSEICGG